MYDGNVYELLYMIHCGDDNAFNILCEKYRPYMLKKYGELHKANHALEFDDVIQAGYLAVMSAVDSYREDLDVHFDNFAILCIERAILSMQGKVRKKHAVDYMTSLSLDSPLKEDGKLYLGDVIFAKSKLDTKEESQQYILLESIYKLLEDSPLELNVLRLRLMGYSYNEIAKRLNIKPKKVDNLYQSIRKKLAVLLEK